MTTKKTKHPKADWVKEAANEAASLAMAARSASVSMAAGHLNGDSMARTYWANMDALPVSTQRLVFQGRTAREFREAVRLAIKRMHREARK